MKASDLTGRANYFEDFTVGEVLKHARGKTVEPMEQVWITNVTMNTAEGHFNDDAMRKAAGHGIFGNRGVVVFGGINLSMVLGLAAQDTAEQCLAEIGLDKIRLSNPVFHGDTLYAYSEVLDKREADREDAGIVVFRHYGLNQDDKLCVEAERTVMLKRKSHWADR